MTHSHKLIITVLLTTSLYGMDQEDVQKAHTCDVKHLRTIPVTSLIKNPQELFLTVLPCSNYQEALTTFDTTLKEYNPARKDHFAHLVNNAAAKKGVKENFFLRKLVERGYPR